jgi:FkbM family methyltransferase
VTRPFLLQRLPERVALSVWARWYRGSPSRWAALCHDASLRHAPEVRMELVPGDLISGSIACTGVYDSTLSRRVVTLARAGGLFVDVGANLGYFSLLWAAGHPDNRCVALEASAANVGLLRRNVERNGFAPRIQVFPVAAGESRGTVCFDPGPSGQTGWGGIAAQGATDGVLVEMVRVDEIIGDEQVALLKIDIEGADAWALKGCDRLLKERAVRELWFEQNKPRSRALGIPERAALDYLHTLDYVARPMSDPNDTVVEWVAVPG